MQLLIRYKTKAPRAQSSRFSARNVRSQSKLTSSICMLQLLRTQLHSYIRRAARTDRARERERERDDHTDRGIVKEILSMQSLQMHGNKEEDGRRSVGTVAVSEPSRGGAARRGGVTVRCAVPASPFNVHSCAIDRESSLSKREIDALQKWRRPRRRHGQEEAPSRRQRLSTRSSFPFN